MLDSFAYVLDDVGNVESVEQVDGSVWDYWYDGRYRLTKAVRDNAQTSPTITATYEYTYDDGDNMLTKVHPFEDRFDDGNYTGWSTAETWSASNGYMDNTASSTGYPRFWKSAMDADYDLRFSYLLEDDTDTTYYVAVNLRNAASGDVTELRLTPTQALIREKVSGAWSTLDSDTSADTVADTWYDVRVLADGSDITVWWGESAAGGGSMHEILSTTSAGVTDISLHRWMVFNEAEFQFDNIQIISDDFDSTTTFAYNDANELTTMTQPDGSQVDFEYDLWGRMTKKALGTTYEATYGYRYFHKLLDFDSDWPGEANVDYQYDGVGKRRERTVNSITTKYNWSGLAVINEENSSGTLTRFYSGSTTAHVDGSNPATGDYYYYFHDLLGSPTAQRDQSKALTLTQEFTPFGQLYLRHTGIANRGFTGHELDGKTGFYYAAFRNYSPGTGRWLLRDPLGLVDGTNMYAYVMNNPVSLHDPLGLLIEDLPELFGGFCSGARDGAMQLADTMIPFGDPFAGQYDPNAPGMREGAIAANIADIANPFGGGKYKAGGKALAALPKTVKHHAVPKAVLKKLPKRVRNHPDVRGRRGKPNKWPIPEDKHKDIHRGPRGGPYNDMWWEELDALGRRPGVKDVCRIRDKVTDAFDVKPPY